MLTLTSTKTTANSALYVGVGQTYYLGASSSPDLIIVTYVDAKIVKYSAYPFKVDRTIDIRIFRDLVVTGTNTWLKSGYAEYHPKTAQDLRGLLAGTPGKVYEAEDLQPVYALVRCTDSAISDPWSDIEARFIPHDVSAECDGVLEVSWTRGEMEGLREMLTGSEYEIVGIKER